MKRNAAGILLVAHDTCRFMVVKRSGNQIYSPNIWAAPAGGIENNEHPLEAALRELEEETGYDRFKVKDIRKLYNSESDTINFTLYIGKVPKEFNPTLDQEHTAFEWINYKLFDAYLTYDFHKDLVSNFSLIKEYIEEVCYGNVK